MISNPPPAPLGSSRGIRYLRAMRIIAGDFRGRNLLPPVGPNTRPITDRVKQSLFDILAPRIDGSIVFDCFAGTGSMGLECLSRGVSHVTFFESDRSALNLLKKNISALKVDDRSRIIATDLFKWFASNQAGQQADLIFLDPPYRYVYERPPELQQLAAHLANKMAPGGLILFRHDSADALSLPPLNVLDRREYGGMVIEFLALDS